MGYKFGISPRGITQHVPSICRYNRGEGTRSLCIQFGPRKNSGVRVVSTYFSKNKLVQENAFLHVGESDSRHDEQTADHQALAPCLEDQALTSRPTSVIRHFGF